MSLTPLDKAALLAEYDLILETLKKNKFNKSKTAEILQIDRKTLYNKIEAYEKYITSNVSNNKSIPETY